MTDKSKQKQDPEVSENPLESKEEEAKTSDINPKETLEDEIENLKDQLLRSIAEQENLRKRLEREKADMAKYAISNLARELITIADNFERALGSVSKKDIEDNPTAKSIIDGIQLTEAELLRVLKLAGVKKLEPTPHDKFDPNFHQAMFEANHDEIPKGHITEVAQAGYSHHERLLRPAMVGVSKGKD